MAKQKASRERCPLCGDEFATRAEREEHKEIVHSTMNRKSNLDTAPGSGRRSSDDIEPADGTPTTELPPGAEDRVTQSSPRGSAPRELDSRNSGARNSGSRAKSKRAGK